MQKKGSVEDAKEVGEGDDNQPVGAVQPRELDVRRPERREVVHPAVGEVATELLREAGVISR